MTKQTNETTPVPILVSWSSGWESVNVLMPTTSARERVYLEGCVRHSRL